MSNIFVDDKVPTSTLLELKAGDAINNNHLAGVIKQINITETDEF